MKKIVFKKKPIVCLTAYNKFYAELIDEYCDLILVGDSLSMAYYGYPSTRSITIQDMIKHGKSVRQGIKKSIMVVDMPYGSYITKKQALKNAKKIIKETKCDAVKLEGGTEIQDIIKNLVDNKINVMGHIGLLPQSVKRKKDYKVKGKNNKEIKIIIDDLKSIEMVGAFSIVLEAVNLNVANKVIKESKIPIIGIGASKNCDGQILVLEDMLGLFDKVPKFVKKYMNLRSQIKNAVQKYSNEVRIKKFPSSKNIYI
ncbi:MAG: 3-methyl-2-oxobutanoate hydroxymethyltransferase [Pelagibacteraceae bacterium]|nr:3-methyl-2-oxobutanoate hydroxymethyltransferase [Pelagibacteraceae bacterium]MCI5079006.1 3-methyl-2-oxobutanoate hydroxymethyltransferase [Pelagibacteraceae bacterium]